MKEVDQARLNRISARLRIELTAALNFLPQVDRGASAMSRVLGLERTTCQRIVAALKKSRDAAEFVTRLPGVRALAGFANAMRKAGAEEEDVVALESAVRDFDRFVSAVARSKSELALVVRAAASQSRRSVPGPVSPSAVARAREDHFHASTIIAGRWSETHLGVQLLRPVPGDANWMELISIRGYLEHQAHDGAMPLALYTGVTGEAARRGVRFEAIAGTNPAALDSPGILEPFCSKPIPTATPRHGTYVLSYLIDADGVHRNKPFDFVVGQKAVDRIPHPRTSDVPVHVSLNQAEYPSRQFVFDVYLHEELARNCIPSLSPHMLGMHLDVWRDTWPTQLPHGPRLQVLGSHAEPADEHPVAQAVTRYVADAEGWALDEFVGFRCEVAYPVWRAYYMMQFDFGRVPRGG